MRVEVYLFRRSIDVCLSFRLSLNLSSRQAVTRLAQVAGYLEPRV